MKRIVVLTAIVGFAGWGVAPSAASAAALTEGHARSAMVQYGCSNVAGLSMAPGGDWYGTCSKGGQTVNLMVDPEGKVSPAVAKHLTDSHARSILTQWGCSNISNLSRGPTGTWHGMCTKGGAVTQVMVDEKGTPSAATGTHLSEGNARSILTQYGCSNISGLSSAADGSWTGNCSKGGSVVMVTVDSAGKPAIR